VNGIELHYCTRGGAFLKQANCDEVNFWKPGGKTNFKALNEGDLFLFKLHSPKDYIVGGGLLIREYLRMRF
jgi:hypothetical protein